MTPEKKAFGDKFPYIPEEDQVVRSKRGVANMEKDRHRLISAKGGRSPRQITAGKKAAATMSQGYSGF